MVGAMNPVGAPCDFSRAKSEGRCKAYMSTGWPRLFI